MHAFASNRVVILRYHSVRPPQPAVESYMPAGITHSPETFLAQIEYVAKTCHPVSIRDLPGFIEGSIAIPERAVLITFDDGFQDNYEVAAPILEQYGLRGVFYICTSSVEGRPLWIVRLRHWSVAAGINRARFLEVSAHCASLTDSRREEFLAGLEHANSASDSFTMTWAQCRHLIERGHTIGSHTVNHPNTAKIPRGELIVEMEASKKILETRLGTTIDDFSYPNPILEPHWDQSTIEVCRRAGYKTAVTSTEGSVTTGTDPFAIPRRFMADNLTDFAWSLEMAFTGWHR